MHISLFIIKNILVLSRMYVFPAFNCVCSTRLVSSVLSNYVGIIPLQNIGVLLCFHQHLKILVFNFWWKEGPFYKVHDGAFLLLGMSWVTLQPCVYASRESLCSFESTQIAFYNQTQLRIEVLVQWAMLSENGFVYYRSQVWSSNNYILLQVSWMLKRKKEKKAIKLCSPKKNPAFCYVCIKHAVLYIFLPAVRYFISFIANCKFLRFLLIGESSLSYSTENHNG